MFLGTLVLITALAISAVAIYYSVAGLVAIFAAAAIPIMIMGGILEIAKLVAAAWLHRYWNQAKWWLKYYLVSAIVVLMFITSMGIFGFLSKAHIEQTASATEGLAQIQRIEAEIQRQTDIIQRAEQEIVSIQQSRSQVDTTIQDQIDREQERINSAYSRIQPAIDEQTQIIENEQSVIEERVAIFQTQLDQINSKLAELTDALSSGDIRRAQGIVGERQDGSLGGATRSAISDFREGEEAKRNQLLERIESIRTESNPVLIQAREEITRLRNLAEAQISESNDLINRLRRQLGTVDVESVNQNIQAQEQIIAESRNTIDTLTEQQYTLQAEYRALEAEVGPIKYIAEFVYGETDQMLLEEAVRWVIIIIIFVFDPLAVLLLIASQATFEIHRNKQTVDNAEEETNYDYKSIDNKRNEHTQSIDRTEEHIPDRTTQTSTGSQTIDIDSYARWIGTKDNGRDLDQSRREEKYDELNAQEEIKNAKQSWKADNPNLTIKEQKDLYIQGKIDELPWESYVQNSEQNSSSIWNKIKSNDRD